MNRLKNQRAYLAGPIDRCKDNGKTWRQNLTPFLNSMGVTVLNPMMKPINIGREDTEARSYRNKLKSSENYDELSYMMKQIRNVDLRMVDISDFLIVNLDLDIHPCGTLEEIFLANREKKPIIIHMEQGKSKTPDWLFGTLPHQLIFSSWEEVKDYLGYVNENSVIETYNRWYFFKI